MTYRVAIAISGAVSLGAYEAGVMFEIIRAIGLHNKNVQDPNEQIKIDVLTGASAGGMTASILAQKLLFEGNALDDPKNNSLYQPWIEMADVQGMLTTDQGDDPDKSILSSSFIAKIAERFLLTRYDTNSAPTTIRHLASADSIHLGLAMSNINGVDYHLEVFDEAELAEPNTQFIYTRFQDQMTREVTSKDDDKNFWVKIAKAARSCGAFPFAFRALHVKRDKTEIDYDDPALKGYTFPPQAFTYTDGGVFNNSPLGMAKDLADKIDTQPRDYERRYFIYISPDRKNSSANLEISEQNATMFALGKALGLSIFQQGRFQDWIMTGHYNEVIDQFDDRCARLAKMMLGIESSEINAIANVAGQLLDHIYAKRESDKPSREADFERLKAQFIADDEARKLLKEKGEQAINAWIQAAQVLEQSGRIGEKDMMQVYTITARKEELAGDGLVAFAGFFDHRFREHDYAEGRKKAREFLKNLKSVVGTNSKPYLPLTQYDFPDEVPQIDDTLKNANLKDINVEVRKALYHRLCDRGERVLHQVGVNMLLRKGIMFFFVRSKIKKVLSL